MIKSACLLLIILFGLALHSCSDANKDNSENLFNLSKNIISLTDFENKIKDTVKPIKDIEKVMLNFDIDYNVRYAYQLYGYRPFWFTEHGLRNYTKELPMQFMSLIDEGININEVFPGRFDSIINGLSNTKIEQEALI